MAFCFKDDRNERICCGLLALSLTCMSFWAGEKPSNHGLSKSADRIHVSELIGQNGEPGMSAVPQSYSGASHS